LFEKKSKAVWILVHLANTHEIFHLSPSLRIVNNLSAGYLVTNNIGYFSVRTTMKAALSLCLAGCLIATTFAEGSLRIQPELTSDHEVKAVGESASLPCTVVGSGFDGWKNSVIWYKITQDGEEIMINTNSAVNEPFDSTGRYRMRRDPSDGSIAIRITLDIDNISVAENGTYRCVLKDNSKIVSHMEHHLIVPEPVKELILTTNKSRSEQDGNITHTVFEFEKLKPAFVSCSSTGGNPMPTLKMYRGRVDVTDEFEQNVIETRIGPKGLEEVKYEIQLVNSNFLASPEYNRHNLKCVSRVPRSGKSDKMPHHKQTRVAKIVVSYAPVFDCPLEWAAFVATEQFAIHCSVHANPPIDANDLSWHVGDIKNGTEIGIGKSVDGLSANASVDSETSKMNVSLTIDQVNNTHFQNYVLKARNELGERHFYAKLSLATTTISTSTTERSPNFVDKGNKSPDSKPVLTGGSASYQGSVHWTVVASLLTSALLALLRRREA